MPVLKFKDLFFRHLGDRIEITLLNLFCFFIEKKHLEKISKFKITEHSIEFTAPDAKEKFYNLLAFGLENLVNKNSRKKAVYIHKNSGVPLLGNIAFGIIDRHTNIIEIKPITSCNLNCIYCSVDADKRKTEFVVEKDYIIQEFKKIIDYKQEDNIEAHIGGQGEPLLYADIVGLVKDLKKIKQVRTISIDTNATLLTKRFVDKLVDAGLTRFNISINAFDGSLCRKIAGTKAYNLEKIKKICRYISEKADIILAPIWLKGINDAHLPEIIEFAKSLKNKKHKIMLGIQNYLYYRFGKNPVKQQSWKKFRKKLLELEKEHNTRLILDLKKDFNIKQTKPLPKPFKKSQIIKAKIILPGQLDNEYIAVAENRAISVFGKTHIGKTQKIKITRTKHNIFSAKII